MEREDSARAHDSELTRKRVPVREDGLTGADQVPSLGTGKIEGSAEALRAGHNPSLSLHDKAPRQCPSGNWRDKTTERDAIREVIAPPGNGLWRRAASRNNTNGGISCVE